MRIKFINDLNEQCGKIVAPLDFTNIGFSYYRLINDVFQGLHIEELKKVFTDREGRTFRKAIRVEFTVRALAEGLDAKKMLYENTPVFLYYLKEFEMPQEIDEDRDNWHFGEANRDFCLREITRFMEEYMMPFFAKANDCVNALPELLKIEKRFYNNRLMILKKQGWKDQSGRESIILTDSVKYHMAIKNGDFDFAVKSGEARLKKMLENYEKGKAFYSNQKKERIEESISELREQIIQIKKRNVSFWNDFVAKNEAKSRKNFESLPSVRNE